MTFAKYSEHGAYHWGSTYAAGFRRRSPRSHGRYDLPLQLLAERLTLPTCRGADIGCGDGVMVYKLWRRGVQVTGLDSSEAGLALARRELDARGAKSALLVSGSAIALPFADGSLDLVTSIEVIEHVAEVDVFLREVRRVLKPGGWFACTTPNRLPTQAKDAVRDPYHVREYVAPELREVLAPYFPELHLFGANPGWLDDPYAEGKGVTAKALRLGVKLVSLAWNPFAALTARDPDQRWRQLVALGRT